MCKLHSYFIVVVTFFSAFFIYSDDSQIKFDSKDESPSTLQTVPCPTTPNGVIDIQKVMDYPIPHVIARFCKTYQVSKEDAKVYERELKRYFILAAAYPEDRLSMLSSDVDDLWHTFLLFTVDYEKFCTELFGRFIHHVPKVADHDLQENS